MEKGGEDSASIHPIRLTRVKVKSVSAFPTQYTHPPRVASSSAAQPFATQLGSLKMLFFRYTPITTAYPRFRMY